MIVVTNTITASAIALGSVLIADGPWQSVTGDTFFKWLACLAIVLGICLLIKQLFLPQKLSPQPLIVALEKEFCVKRDFEKFEKYIHGKHHEFAGQFQAITSAGEHRDEILATLDERTKTESRDLQNLNLKVDRLADRIADKIEAVLVRMHKAP